jgi:hypothetical protein
MIFSGEVVAVDVEVLKPVTTELPTTIRRWECLAMSPSRRNTAAMKHLQSVSPSTACISHLQAVSFRDAAFVVEAFVVDEEDVAGLAAAA